MGSLFKDYHKNKQRFYEKRVDPWQEVRFKNGMKKQGISTAWSFTRSSCILHSTIIAISIPDLPAVGKQALGICLVQLLVQMGMNLTNITATTHGPLAGIMLQLMNISGIPWRQSVWGRQRYFFEQRIQIQKLHSSFFHLRAYNQHVNYSGAYNWGCSL